DSTIFIHVLDVLASAEASAGDAQAAVGHHQRALAIAEKVFGPDDVRTSSVLLHLAAPLFELGRYDEAAAAGERAIAIRDEAGRGATIPTAIACVNAGDSRRKLREYPRAIALLTRARDIFLAQNSPYVTS